MTADPTGAWTDHGYVRTLNVYHYEETLELKVLDQAGVVVGRGDVSCSFTAA